MIRPAQDFTFVPLAFPAGPEGIAKLEAEYETAGGQCSEGMLLGLVDSPDAYSVCLRAKGHTGKHYFHSFEDVSQVKE
jgi:hypothetical protein